MVSSVVMVMMVGMLVVCTWQRVSNKTTVGAIPPNGATPPYGATPPNDATPPNGATSPDGAIPPDDITPPNGATLPDSSGTTLCEAMMHTESSQGPRPNSIFVVYSSCSTSEERKAILHHLVNQLMNEHQIEVCWHEIMTQRGISPYMVESKIKLSSAVLCVCNKAFYDEWNGNIPPPQASTVAYIKSLLAADLQCGKDISKYAVVLLKKRDVQYIPTHYLSSCKQFNVTDQEGIVHFILKVLK